MKIQVTPEIMEQGRELLRKKDVEGFDIFLRSEFKFIQHDKVMRHINFLIKTNNAERAVQLFNVLQRHNNVREGIFFFFGKGIKLAILLGIVGGFIYIIKGVT